MIELWVVLWKALLKEEEVQVMQGEKERRGAKNKWSAFSKSTVIWKSWLWPQHWLKLSWVNSHVYSPSAEGINFNANILTHESANSTLFLRLENIKRRRDDLAFLFTFHRCLHWESFAMQFLEICQSVKVHEQQIFFSLWVEFKIMLQG